MASDFVFGYGSLAAHPGGQLTELRGFRREWGVAMDNRRDLPGYKYFEVERSDGRFDRPELFVAFLDIVEDVRMNVNGALIPVGSEQLDALDERERNYRRIEVSDRFDDPPGTVWMFVGSTEARERRALAHARDELVAQREYVDSVVSSFRTRGSRHFERYVNSTQPIDFPVLDLRRVDLR